MDIAALNSRIKSINDEADRGSKLLEGISCFSDPDDLSIVIEKAESIRENYVLPLGKSIAKLLSELSDSQQIAQETKTKVANDLSAVYNGATDIFNSANLHVAKVVSASNKMVLRRTREGLVNQLSVFSIVLTVLTFVLNSAKLSTQEGANFYTIMAGNMSFILMSLVMFSIIYYFLHVDEGIKQVAKKTKLFFIRECFMNCVNE